MITVPSGSTPIGSWGDAGEAFRPLCDFGDAPASYDPNPLSPAVNERDTALRIGGTFDREWIKTSSALADADGADEDGVATVTIFNPTNSTYQVQVSVRNNTGANARLIGWLDYNGNGLFDTGEASAVVSVPSSTLIQNPWLNWTGISSSLVDGAYTYLRIRITTTANGMTTANSTGWFDNGETEDYRVSVSTTILPVSLLSFEAKTINNSKVKLDWSASEEINFQGYEVERSNNGTDWEYVAFVSALQNSTSIHEYELTDINPYKGTSRYRLKLKEASGSSRYSEVRIVKISDLASLITLSPNPAINIATVTITSHSPGEVATIQVTDAKGTSVFNHKSKLSAGNNPVELPVQAWPSGTYLVMVNMNEGVTTKKLVLQR
jgi:hypothetical protein